MIEFFLNILNFSLIYSIFAMSLNLVWGFGGLLNLGHIVLIGLGAYSSSLATLKGFPFFISFLISLIFGGLFGFLISLATKRITKDYFALFSFGFTFIIYSLFLNLTFITRGPLGLPGIKRPEIIGNNFNFLIFSFILTVFTYFIFKKIVSSKFGLVLSSSRDDELLSKTLGKNVFKIRKIVFSISGIFSGLAGFLFAHYIQFIDPSSFFLSSLLTLLIIVLIGGLASLEGSIIASFIVIAIPEILRLVNLPLFLIGPLREIIFSIILILILLYKPKGILGKITFES